MWTSSRSRPPRVPNSTRSCSQRAHSSSRSPPARVPRLPSLRVPRPIAACSPTRRVASQWPRVDRTSHACRARIAISWPTRGRIAFSSIRWIAAPSTCSPRSRRATPSWARRSICRATWTSSRSPARRAKSSLRSSRPGVGRRTRTCSSTSWRAGTRDSVASPAAGPTRACCVRSPAVSPCRRPGRYRLRVSGTRDRTDPDRGPYRLLLYKVNPRPETAPDTLALGDSVSRESIDVPGDVDEWRVTVPDSTGVDLVVQRGPDGPEGVLTAQLLDATGRAVASAYSFGPGFGTAGLDQMGRLALAPGTYTVRVDGSWLLRGSYRVWLYAFKFGPESVRDTFAIGDTVAGESIDPLGDVDRFRFYAMRGHHVNIAFQALSGPLAASLWSPRFAVEPGWRGTVGSPSAAASLRDHQSMRVDLAETGWYMLEVGEGSSPKPGPTERGPYRYTVELLGTSPEGVPSALVPGDSVTGEAIDAPGAERRGEYFGSCYDATCGNVFRFVGPYRFRVVAVNRAPENVPSSFALGDTVRGEAIFPAGDIDEFTSTGTPGEAVSPWWRLTANPVPIGSLISLEVVDPATGTVLAGRGASLVGSGPQYWSPGSFVVPPAGAYLIRVRGGGTFGDEVGTAPYEFFVKRGP